MDGEPLPHWFWLIYYSFLILVLWVGISNILKKRMYIVLTITVQIISIWNNLFLDLGTNELTHLIAELKAGAKWSIFVVLGRLYMVIYIAGFFIKKCISLYQNH